MNERLFLTSLISSPHLTAYDASIILLTHDRFLLPDSTKTSLLSKVHGADWNWIGETELFEVSLRILALHSTDRSFIDGACIGHLAKRLIRSEIKIGGPYHGDTHFSTLATNVLISQLFIRLGTRLPNIDAYIKNELIRHNTLQLEKGEWVLIWPQHYISPDNALVNADIMQHPNIPLIIKAALSISPPLPHSVSHPRPVTLNSVTAATRQELLKLDLSVRPMALKIWESLHHADKRSEISMLSHYFALSLNNPDTVSDSILDQLGAANYYTWMAYTIYDDFIDDEGSPDQLPVANMMHRRALHDYRQIAKNNRRSLALINKSYDTVDIANSWELAHCRCKIMDNSIEIAVMPSYRTRHILARRAHAHILGPLLIMDLIVNTPAQYRAASQGLNHYLIARQINDDIHDWKQDLARGHISFVVAYLLRKLQIHPGIYEIQYLTILMQNYFWKNGLEELCRIIITHTQRAAAYYSKSNLLQIDSVFTQNTLGYIEQSARQSIVTHNDQIQFLKVYRDDNVA